MKTRVAALLLGIVALSALLVPSCAPTRPPDSPGASQKLRLAIPEFARGTPGSDESSVTRILPEIIANDLRFSSLFAVVANEPPLPDDTEAGRKRLADLAAAGVHAALQGRVDVGSQRVTVEFGLFDLTDPNFRRFAFKSFWVEPPREHRQLAHRIADEIVYQLSGERGIAETKIAFVTRSGLQKEIAMIDYDGFNEVMLTNLQSVSLSPAWNPIDSTLAVTSYYKGYPYLFHLFPYYPRRREPELISAWPGINMTAAWAPDGRTLALTLTKDGNPEIYALRVGTSDFRRLTNNGGIDTDPTWSPTGREIAFSSDRNGAPQIWVMDAGGTNPRRLTTGGYDTQPRWSPRGDTIVFTRRNAGVFDLWAIAPDGSNERRLTQGAGSNESAAWAPNGRHLVFSSSRTGRPQLFTMLDDGTEQQGPFPTRGEAWSPTWSPRPQ